MNVVVLISYYLLNLLFQSGGTAMIEAFFGSATHPTVAGDKWLVHGETKCLNILQYLVQ